MIVHKYKLGFTGLSQVLMHPPVRFLKVGEQARTLVVWVLVDETRPQTIRNFYVIGTGHPVPEDMFSRLNFIDSKQTESGLVWHVFDAGEVK